MLCREGFSREDVAAVTIQAYFRAHLARRAFKALRSLARVRSRQALAKPKDNDDKLLLLQN
uniref:Uncharacterized protein n=1 Tax=Aegilops tauschii TaxID=37682 RepID=M8C0M8_AEGTA